MANPTSNFNWQMPTPTDLVTDLPADFEVFGQAVDSSMADLLGGTSGQILAKNSNANMDFVWITNDVGDITAVTAGTGLTGGGTSGAVTLNIDPAYAGFTNLSNMTNPVLNSAMQIAQRGTTISLAASAGTTYTLDRWCTQTGANQACTVTQEVTGDTTNLPFIQYALRYKRNTSQTGTGGLTLLNAFETINSRPFAGKAVTLSFYARKGADYSATASALAVKLDSGTGTDQNPFAGYTGAATVCSTTATLTTTWQRFTATGTVGATATELNVQVVFTPTGTAGANDYYEITGVQVDVGSVALPFRTYAATIQGELSACQRYYISYTSSDGSLTSGFATGTTNAYRYGVYLPTSMRTTPSASSVGTLIFYDGTALVNITGIGAVRTLTSSGNVNAVSVDFTVASGLTQYRPYMLLIQSATFILSAEL
jgi:hypothetical protein